MTALQAMGQTIPALGLIIGGLLLVRWIVQRKGGSPIEQVRVTARAGLSRNASVVVVEVADKRWLLGVTEQNVQLIAPLQSDEDATLATQALIPNVTTSPTSNPSGGDGAAAPTNFEQVLALRAAMDRSTQSATTSAPTGSRQRSLPSVGTPALPSASTERPRTGLISRLQRATTRGPSTTSWQRAVDDLRT